MNKNLTVLFMISALLCGFLFSSSAIADEALPAKSAPRLCSIRLPVWCIYKDEVIIQIEPSFDRETENIWTIWEPQWRNHPMVVIEPVGCRLGLANTNSLSGYSDSREWNGKRWNSVIVRLKSDKTCDLELLSPLAVDDEAQGAFTTKMTLLQSCTTSACDQGPAIGDSIWPLIQKRVMQAR